MSELIDKQAAIDAMQKLIIADDEEGLMLMEYNQAVSNCIDKIAELPPVTPAKKQEPCTDAISRQAAIDALDCINGVEEVLKSLSSVEPERKIGRWITVDKGLMVTSYKCSECGRIERDDTGYDVTKDYPYCHCGAKMQEVER